MATAHALKMAGTDKINEEERRWNGMGYVLWEDAYDTCMYVVALWWTPEGRRRLGCPKPIRQVVVEVKRNGVD
jgi:hypothetical protein